MNARKLFLAAFLGLAACTGAYAAPEAPPTKPPASKVEMQKKYTLMYRVATAPDKPGSWEKMTGLSYSAVKEKEKDLKKLGFKTRVQVERFRPARQ